MISQSKSGILSNGTTVRVNFDLDMYSNIYGSYGNIKIIPWSGNPKPKLNETWDVQVLTSWENENNRSTKFIYSAMVKPLKKVT